MNSPVQEEKRSMTLGLTWGKNEKVENLCLWLLFPVQGEAKCKYKVEVNDASSSLATIITSEKQIEIPKKNITHNLRRDC